MLQTVMATVLLIVIVRNALMMYRVIKLYILLKKNPDFNKLTTFEQRDNCIANTISNGMLNAINVFSLKGTYDLLPREYRKYLDEE